MAVENDTRMFKKITILTILLAISNCTLKGVRWRQPEYNTSYVDQALNLPRMKYYCVIYEIDKSHDEIDPSVIKIPTEQIFKATGMQPDCETQEPRLNVHIDIYLDATSYNYYEKQGKADDLYLYGLAELDGTILFKTGQIEQEFDFNGRWLIQETSDAMKILSPAGAPFFKAMHFVNEHRHRPIWELWQPEKLSYAETLVRNLGYFSDHNFWPGMLNNINLHQAALNGISTSNDIRYAPSVLAYLKKKLKGPAFVCRKNCIQAIDTLGHLQATGAVEFLGNIALENKDRAANDLELLHALAIALGRIGGPQSLEYLKKLQAHIYKRFINASAFSLDRPKLNMLEYDINVAINEIED